MKLPQQVHFSAECLGVRGQIWIAYSVLSDGKVKPYQFGLATTSGFWDHSSVTWLRTNRNQLVNIYLIQFNSKSRIFWIKRTTESFSSMCQLYMKIRCIATLSTLRAFLSFFCKISTPACRWQWHCCMGFTCSRKLDICIAWSWLYWWLLGCMPHCMKEHFIQFSLFGGPLSQF